MYRWRDDRSPSFDYDDLYRNPHLEEEEERIPEDDSDIEELEVEVENSDGEELPDIREANRMIFLRQRRNWISPTLIEVPDYPIDDEASLLRHFIQDNQEYLGVKTERCIDKAVEEIMKYPREKEWKTVDDVKDFLFGWTSLEWRRQLSERNSRNYANVLVLKVLWEINEKMKEAGYKGSLLTIDNHSLFANFELSDEQLESFRHLPKLL